MMAPDITRIMEKASDNAPYIIQSAKTYSVAGVGISVATLDVVTGVAQAVLVFLSIVAVCLRIYSDGKNLKKKKKK